VGSSSRVVKCFEDGCERLSGYIDCAVTPVMVGDRYAAVLGLAAEIVEAHDTSVPKYLTGG
jgi:hypothetical protein